jgi:hypothetical protein
MRTFFFGLFCFLFLWGGIWVEAGVEEEDTAVSPSSTPSPGTPSPLTPQATPTIDRLAQPPTAENPTQVDEGHYLYWLYCIPCHGDMGQGLTDEWRAEYPEEEQYCWNSGCHGSNPPQPYGFQIPTVVPPIMLHYGGLERFDTLGQIYYYTRGAMPLEMPGKLTDEEYLAIMAFMANEMGLWQGAPYDDRNILQVWLRPEEKPQPTATPALDLSTAVAPGSNTFAGLEWVVLIGVSAFFVIGGIGLWHRQRQ